MCFQVLIGAFVFPVHPNLPAEPCKHCVMYTLGWFGCRPRFWHTVYGRSSNFHLCLACAAAESPSSAGEIPWCFSQVKGTIEEEVTEG